MRTCVKRRSSRRLVLFYGHDIISFCQHLRDPDVWRHLDSIATHPNGSRLQRVDISIEYALEPDYGEGVSEPYEDVMEAVLDALPLLRTKDILFVNASELSP